MLIKLLIYKYYKMKYYKVNIKRFYENDMIATDANGDDVEDAEYYFDKIKNGEQIIDAPVFDYFHLESFDKREYWEWMIADVHKFIGEGSQIQGWLVSEKLKHILENFNIANPHSFYLAKLFYKEEKLNYFIFQFMSSKTFREALLNINFSSTFFLDPVKKKKIKAGNIDDFLIEYKRIYKENGIENKMKNKKLVLTSDLDFFPMQSFLGDNIISERLKKVMEENEITGFEFSELDYEVITENSNLC